MHDGVAETGVESARRHDRISGAIVSDAATRAIYLVVGALTIGLIFWKLQFSNRSICCGDFDGYYHIRWSRLLWENMRAGHLFPPTFKWLPLTTLDPKGYVDHHLLFHILQIPFTWLGDLRLAAKVSATLFSSLAVFSCYWLIVRYRISYTLVWLVAMLACSAPFLYRLNMAKAPPISIIFMVAGIYLLFEKKYRWLAPLAFLYVWTYSLFVTLVAAAVIWTAVVGWSELRFEWRPLVWTALGTIAGFIINPYFPKNVSLFLEHLWIKVRLGDFSTSVGSEWYPYESWFFLGSCLVAFAAMLVGYIAFDWRDRRRATRPLFFLIFSTLLMVMSFRSRRFVEYWPPFAVLFAAFALQTIFDGARARVGRLPEDVLDELQPFLDRSERAETVRSRRHKEYWQTGVAAFVALLLGVVLVVNVHETAKGIAGEAGPDRYKGGMDWVRSHVPEGEMVFNTDWDDFPKMFFYDTTHTYASGLDPTYLLDKNPELSKLYEDITLGKIKEAAPIIRDRFGAHYVFSDNEDVHNDFYFNAKESGWFDIVYEDDECTVLQIRDQKGVALPDEDEGEDSSTDEPDDAGDQQEP
jgi:asparagine N-glycosylation enzyme membrane subunit Stt3